MWGRACAASFGVVMALATLALTAYAINEDRDKSSAFLEALTTVVVGGATVFLILCILFGFAFGATLTWRYFHAVEVLSGQWYCRYWPGERIAQVSGVGVAVNEWAGTVRVSCHARFGLEEVAYSHSVGPHAIGTLLIEFPQQKVDFASEPKEGDPAVIAVAAEPRWWCGRPSRRTQRIEIGITDHRLSVTPEQVRDAISRIDPLIGEAQAILDSCGRPREQMRGADPMHFLNECIPRINKFGYDAAATINEVAPECMGKLQNVGNVTHNTDVKPAMIQQLEKWLENLGAIQDELRRRL